MMMMMMDSKTTFTSLRFDKYEGHAYIHNFTLCTTEVGGAMLEETVPTLKEANERK